MPDRPNILLIMSDEHDAANMGCYGDPLGATPTLDGLADRGITFDAAYCNSPLCVPSRLSFTAGQYISRCGAWQNTCWLPRR
jgi:choline-sulfatase